MLGVHEKVVEGVFLIQIAVLFNELSVRGWVLVLNLVFLFTLFKGFNQCNAELAGLALGLELILFDLRWGLSLFDLDGAHLRITVLDDFNLLNQLLLAFLFLFIVFIFQTLSGILPTYFQPLFGLYFNLFNHTFFGLGKQRKGL